MISLLTGVSKVYDWDRFSKNDAMGEVAVYLGETDLNNRSAMWSVLQVKKLNSRKPLGGFN